MGHAELRDLGQEHGCEREIRGNEPPIRPDVVPGHRLICMGGFMGHDCGEHALRHLPPFDEWPARADCSR
jgi:hypothetical protein